MLNLYALPGFIHFFSSWTEPSYTFRKPNGRVVSASGVRWSVEFTGPKRKPEVLLTYGGKTAGTKSTAHGAAATIALGNDDRAYPAVLIDGTAGREIVRVYSDDLSESADIMYGRANVPPFAVMLLQAIHGQIEPPDMLATGKRLLQDVQQASLGIRAVAEALDLRARALAKAFYRELHRPELGDPMTMILDVVAIKLDKALGRYNPGERDPDSSLANFIDFLAAERRDVDAKSESGEIPESERVHPAEVLKPSGLDRDTVYVKWEYGTSIAYMDAPVWSTLGAAYTGEAMRKLWSSYVEARRLMASKGRKLILLPAGVHPASASTEIQAPRTSTTIYDMMRGSDAIAAKMMFYGVQATDGGGAMSGVKLPDSIRADDRVSVLTELIGASQSWCAEFSKYKAGGQVVTSELESISVRWRDLTYGMIRQRFAEQRKSGTGAMAITPAAAMLLNRLQFGPQSILEILTPERHAEPATTKPFLSQAAFELIALKVVEYDAQTQVLTLAPEFKNRMAGSAFNTLVAGKIEKSMTPGTGAEVPPDVTVTLSSGTSTLPSAGATVGLTIRVTTTGDKSLLDGLLHKLTSGSTRMTRHSFGQGKGTQVLVLFVPFVGAVGDASHEQDAKTLPASYRSNVWSYLTVHEDIPADHIQMQDTSTSKQDATVDVKYPEFPADFEAAKALASGLGRKAFREGLMQAPANSVDFEKLFLDNPRRKALFPKTADLMTFMSEFTNGYVLESSIESYLTIFAPDYLDDSPHMAQHARDEFKSKVKAKIQLARKKFIVGDGIQASTLRLASSFDFGQKTFDTYDKALVSEYESLGKRERHLFDLLSEGYSGLDTRELGDLPAWTSKSDDMFPNQGDIDLAVETLARRRLVDIHRVHHRLVRRRRRVPELSDHGLQVYESIHFKRNGAEPGLTNAGSTLVGIRLLLAKSPIGTRITDSRDMGESKNETAVPLYEKYGNADRLWIKHRPGFWALHTVKYPGAGLVKESSVEASDADMARVAIQSGVWFESGAPLMSSSTPALRVSKLVEADTAPPSATQQVVRLYCEDYRIGNRKFFTVRIPATSRRLLDPADMAMIRRFGFGDDPKHGLFKIVKSFAERDKLVTFIREALSHMDGVRVEFIRHNNDLQIAASTTAYRS